MKVNYTAMTAFRCDLCRQPVDVETDSRARRGWNPLVVCERCVREAQTGGVSQRMAA